MPTKRVSKAEAAEVTEAMMIRFVRSSYLGCPHKIYGHCSVWNRCEPCRTKVRAAIIRAIKGKERRKP